MAEADAPGNEGSKGRMAPCPAAPAERTPEAEHFFGSSLEQLNGLGVPFLVGGTYAVSAYTGIERPTKDLDIFCKPGDYPRVLALFNDAGFDTEIEDERWLAKVRKGRDFFDVIFNSAASVNPVTDEWFTEGRRASVHGVEVQVLAPTELVWSKAFVQDRHKYDGPDVAHLILRQSGEIDWPRLLRYMDQYWEVLLMHLLNFRFIYPSEREAVPRWLLDELLQRLNERDRLPPPRTRVCRGRLFSRSDYEIDVKEWGFADLFEQGDD